MRFGLPVIALLFPAVVAAEVPDASAAPPPEVAAAAIEVQLVQSRPLALRRAPVAGKEPWLDGALVATVTNRSAAPVRLRALGEHGVVFVGPSGAPQVVVHGCKCVRDAVEPAEASFELAPGASHTITVDEWGCGGGMWEAPPPGRYRVEYRVLPAPAAPPPAEDEQPQLQVARCRSEFSSPQFWTAASVSNPIEVELRAPRGKKQGK